jgi:hypothetical protein
MTERESPWQRERGDVLLGMRGCEGVARPRSIKWAIEVRLDPRPDAGRLYSWFGRHPGAWMQYQGFRVDGKGESLAELPNKKQCVRSLAVWMVRWCVKFGCDASSRQLASGREAHAAGYSRARLLRLGVESARLGQLPVVVWGYHGFSRGLLVGPCRPLALQSLPA